MELHALVGEQVRKCLRLVTASSHALSCKHALLSVFGIELTLIASYIDLLAWKGSLLKAARFWREILCTRRSPRTLCSFEIPLQACLIFHTRFALLHIFVCLLKDRTVSNGAATEATG